MVLQSNLGKWHTKQVNWWATVFTFKWYSHLEEKVIWIISHREKTTCPLWNEEMKSPHFLNRLPQLKVDYKDAKESKQHYRSWIFYFIQKGIKKIGIKHEQTESETEGQRWTGTFQFVAFSIQGHIFWPFSWGHWRHVEDRRQWFNSIWICFPSIHS